MQVRELQECRASRMWGIQETQACQIKSLVHGIVDRPPEPVLGPAKPDPSTGDDNPMLHPRQFGHRHSGGAVGLRDYSQCIRVEFDTGEA